MHFPEIFPSIESQMTNELLGKDFTEDQDSDDWQQSIPLEAELALSDLNDYGDLEDILSQTRLDFDTWSTTSKDPESPQVLDDSDKVISDDDLVNLPIKELNKRFRDLSESEVKNMRRRRRSLKNRGYATNCRQRRVALKETLETQNQRLKSQLRETKEKLSIAMKERDTFKSQFEQLRMVAARMLQLPSPSGLHQLGV